MTHTTTLLDIYNVLERGEITQEQAAEALGFTPIQLKYRQQKWGHRLPLLLATMDKIKADQITREEAADILKISPRGINKLQASWNVERPLKPYLVDRAAVQIKWEIRKKYAIDFIAGATEFAEAAEAAGVSTRQMRRWVSELLKKHYEMPYKDLLTLSMTRRKRLADEIEVAENLEVAKQQVLKSIADSDEAIRTEARRRVMAKHSTSGRRFIDA